MIRVFLRRVGDDVPNPSAIWAAHGPRKVYEYPEANGTRFEGDSLWLVVHVAREAEQKRNLYGEPMAVKDDLAAFPIEVVEAVEYHNAPDKPAKKEKK